MLQFLWLVFAGATALRLRPHPTGRTDGSRRGWVPRSLWDGVGRWISGAFGGRRQRRADRDRLIAELPDAVDLLNLAIGAGLTIPLAVEAVGGRLRGTVAESFRWALDRARLGEPLADALDAVPLRFGEELRQLVRPLVASQRYGVELAPALDALSSEVRLQRRRRAELRARKLPVKLLFPLVLCILPSFALLTVVPVVASSLRAVQL